MKAKKKVAIIIGAGPGGMTAGFELLDRTDITPLILEKSSEVGGISRTVNYKGNRIDIGGHRFFSKSKRVMSWWKMFLPLQFDPSDDTQKNNENIDPEKTDRVMLIRNRLSRIFYLRSFFDYPITLNIKTLKILGAKRIFRISWAYTLAYLFPIKSELNLEDFFINRFGKELYKTFFKDYTEKVWGMPCKEIRSDWGAQRIKNLSVLKTLIHAIISSFPKKQSDLSQSGKETSLIDKFMYPKLGPGQLWEEVKKNVIEKGGQLISDSEVIKIKWVTNENVEVTVQNSKTKTINIFHGNYLFSTMPMKELVSCLEPSPPETIKRVAEGLAYRDFITVGLLVRKLKMKHVVRGMSSDSLIPDNWIYIQEKDVSLGRLQIFNNWSPYLVADSKNVWLGLEYFCNEGDQLWNMSDEDFIAFAIEELSKIDIIYSDDVLDSTIIRVPKAYPAYFGTYDEIDKIIDYTDTFENMFLVGRNGMHKYNNQDHSMLTAMVSVDNILNKITSKENIWNINTEQEYHETVNKEK
jgi:protoporphyrinogen oxidase